MTGFNVFTLMATTLLAVIVIWLTLQVDRLTTRVEHLECNHGESSIAATKIHGKFVITQPAHRTGC